MKHAWFLVLTAFSLASCGAPPPSARPLPQEVPPPPAEVTMPGPYPAVAATASAPAMVVKNGSFEKGMDGWWHWSSREKEATAAAVGGAAADGSFFLQQTLANPQDEVLSLAVQNMDNPVGKTLTVRALLKSDAPGLSGDAYAYIGVEFWRGGEKIGVQDSPNLRGAFPWTPLEVTTLIPPEGAAEARIILVLRGVKGSTGSVAFDSVTVTRE